MKGASKMLENSYIEIWKWHALRFLSRGLIRQSSYPRNANYRELLRGFPYSVNAWESLIGIKLLMDKVDDVEAARVEKTGWRSQNFSAHLRLLWDLIGKTNIAIYWRWLGFFWRKGRVCEDVADIVFRTGDLGNHESSSSFGINPIESHFVIILVEYFLWQERTKKKLINVLWRIRMGFWTGNYEVR